MSPPRLLPFGDRGILVEVDTLAGGDGVPEDGVAARAGAVLEEAPGRRRRADSSAWARLRRHAPAYSPWAERFEAVSPLREDLLLGLKRHPDELEARRIQAMAGDFLAEVSADFGLLDDVA